MSDNFQRIFGVRTLSGIVETFAKEQEFQSLFQQKFMMGRMLEPEGDTAEWDELRMHRHLAPVVGRDSPFPILEHATKFNRASSMAHIKLSKVIPMGKLYSERAPGELRANAAAVVDAEARDMVKAISATVEYMCAQTLNGTLTVNATNIPGSSQAFTIAYTPNTYTASASWHTSTTGLLSSEIPALVDDYRAAAGMNPYEVIVSREIAGSAYKNEETVALISGAPPAVAMAASGAANQGPAWGGFNLGGLQWTVSIGGYVPQGGAFTKFHAGEDVAIVLPGPGDLRDVLGMALGRGFVPGANDVGAIGDAASLGQPAPTRGFYSYATRTVNPVGVELFVGWVGLPLLLFPAGVCVADVTP